MRRIQLMLLMLVPLSAAASAQSPVSPPQSFQVSPGASATPEHVIARLMSFDRDTDGKIAKDELVERMKDLVTRGDTDGDGALDRNEIHILSRMPATTVGVRGFGGFPSSYQLPVESWFPDRSHIDGAIADLKLESSAHARALAVVDAHQPHVEIVAHTAADDLLRRMEGLLTPDQLANFKKVLDRQGTTGVVGFSRAVVTGSTDKHTVVGGAVVRLAEAVFHVRVAMLGGDLSRHIEQYGLTPTKNREARAAVDAYRAGLRDLGQAERAHLAEQMAGIMTADERDDFLAALGRRQAVQTGIVAGVTGDVRRVAFPGVDVKVRDVNNDPE